MKTDLTAKQLEFCKWVLQGHDYTYAYEQVYDTSKMKKSTINNEASLLMKNEKVLAFIESVQQREMLGVFNTRQKYLDKLDDIIDSKSSTMTEKIQAINTVAKLKQWDKRQAGLQVDYQEENDIQAVKYARETVIGWNEVPQKDI
ncbi:terminase small subunit [Pseudofrancisella aestuarii]|uniref:Terminase small subunit n=1 Tax=Pseudofrancisella aestuarii TaxID=2670347 RepID=A0ABV9TDE7_9GAMM|nr:terminase small subunit [Pseudofrancisella aestuarii]